MVALLVLAVLNPTAIFDNKVAVRTSLTVTNVSCTNLEPLWVMAQSVPSASLVPCVRYRPGGWAAAEVTVNNGRSWITLNHDRAGKRALEVRLSATCDPSGTVEGPSATAGVRHFQRTGASAGGGFSVTWYDQFPGGCVTPSCA
jgi:hypothetical protein